MSRRFTSSARGSGPGRLLVAAAVAFAFVCAVLWLGWRGGRDEDPAPSRREVTHRLLGEALVESQATLSAMHEGNFGLAEEHARAANERLTRVMAQLTPAER